MRSAKCGFINTRGGPSASQLLTALGPTIAIDVGFDPSHTLRSIKAPAPGVTNLQALIDTGAGDSCIDNLLAAQLKLPIVDRRRISGSAGPHETNVYLAQVHMPLLNYTIVGAFAGVDLKAGGQVHSALIGRTFLANFRMIYDGPSGDVTLIGEHV